MAIERQSRMRQISLVLSLLATTYSPASAEPAINELEIKPVTITINRFDETNPSNSRGVEVLTTDDIENTSHQALPEFLASRSGLSLTNNFFGNGTQSTAVDLRGFGSVGDENTLVLVNGVRIKNNDLSSVNWSSIPLSSIERIEIGRGSGGVIYGGGATAGYINIITKRQQPGQKNASIETEMGSYGTRSLNLTGNVAGDQAGIFVYAQRYNSDNYRENNEERRSVAKFDYQWYGEVNAFSVSVGSDRQSLRTPGDLGVNPDGGVPIAVIDRKSSDSINDFSTLDGDVVNLSVSQDWNSWTLVEDFSYRVSDSRLFAEGSQEFSVIETEMWQISPRLKYETAATLPGSDFILGLDWANWDRVNTRATDPNTFLTRPFATANLDQTNVALYAQTNVRLTDKLASTVGVRHEKQDSEASDVVDPAASFPFATTNNAATTRTQTVKNNAYEVGLEYAIADNIQMVARTNRSFRVANSDEVFLSAFNLGTFEIDRQFVFLEPQKTYTHEIGVTVSGERSRFSGTVFQIDTKNEIRLDPVAFANTNFPVTQRRGLELQVGWRSATWDLSSTYSYTQPKFMQGERGGVALADKDIPLVPRTKVGMSARFTSGTGFVLGGDLNYTSDQFMTNDETNSFGRKIPSYTLLDLHLSKSYGAFNVALKINNALDREYFTFAVNSTAAGNDAFNFYPLPERSAFLTASYTFGN